MAGDNDAYLSYLLRLWREDSDGETAWRASLESVQAPERIYFQSLDELVTYLRKGTAGPSGIETKSS